MVDVAELPRRQPHDLANAAAAAALASVVGVGREAIARGLKEFTGLAHRLEPIGHLNGAAWFNDSKATVPHATLAAVGGFDSVVLLAGGRNKGLDLSPLADTTPPVRFVIAFGDAGPEVAAAFGDKAIEVAQLADLEAAVELAASRALAGDTVLLSPACTSFDAYPGYGARGDPFRELFGALRPEQRIREGSA